MIFVQYDFCIVVKMNYLDIIQQEKLFFATTYDFIKNIDWNLPVL